MRIIINWVGDEMSIVQNIFRFEKIEERVLLPYDSMQLIKSSNSLLTVVSGMAELNGTITLGLTSVYISNMGVVMELRNNGEKPFVFRVSSFTSFILRQDDRQQLCYELMREYVNYEGLFYHKASNKVRKVSEALFKEQQIPQQAHLLYKLIHTIEEEYKLQKNHVVEISFQSVLAYISKHSHEALKRDEIANYFGYHPNYFSKRIKKETGWSFSDYLAHIRLDKAKVLLLNRNLTIADIARKVGYQDGLYLSRKFRKLTGITPSEFRAFKNYKRIFTFQFTGSLLAAGITPVGTLSWAGNLPPYIVQQLDTTQLIKNGDFPSFEQLRNMSLDLIIGPSYLYAHPQLIEELEKIAPVFILEWDQIDRIVEVETIAAMMGTENSAEEWRENYLAEVEMGKSLLQPLIESGETVGVFELREDEQVGIWRSSARGAYNIYEQLKLVPPPSIQDEVLTPNRHLIIDEYRISSYAADHMLVIVHSEEQGRRLLESDYWCSVRQRYNSKVYILQLEDFWASEGVFLSHQLAIQINKLVNGDFI
ncbi:helix-turn-helix domain-containing protein [Kurthia sibirica]|uniref:HTH araC/xylS-type domain-containing protein n=1 Tax=Kurthia sibirica TaxID=202750 RepID=A0A2U3AQ51_9BACL|nr:AraC family transcriptional regulator [Kurthia sibirica]PWI26657.1 hypothetical protein DEX24_02540 [Kurthia sibirica]